MENKKSRLTLYDIVAVGLMAAVVFVVTMFLSIRIPTPTGTTMIKLANAFVQLCGLLLGPVRGGLAAGFGSMQFDLMTPEYAPEAWITFIRFFLMAWLCGLIAYAGHAAAKKFSRNLIACIVAAVFSSVFYMVKGIVELMIGGSALAPALVSNIPKLLTSPPNTAVVNGISAVVYTSMPLRSYPAFGAICTFKSKSPFSPPPAPGWPLPRRRTLLPSSMPAGMCTLKDCTPPLPFAACR